MHLPDDLPGLEQAAAGHGDAAQVEGVHGQRAERLAPVPFDDSAHFVGIAAAGGDGDGEVREEDLPVGRPPGKAVPVAALEEVVEEVAGATDTCRRSGGIGTMSGRSVSSRWRATTPGTRSDATGMYHVSRWASASAYWSLKLSISSAAAK